MLAADSLEGRELSTAQTGTGREFREQLQRMREAPCPEEGGHVDQRHAGPFERGQPGDQLVHAARRAPRRDLDRGRVAPVRLGDRRQPCDVARQRLDVGAGRRDSAHCLGHYAVHHVTLGDIAAHHRAPEPFEQHEAHRA